MTKKAPPEVTAYLAKLPDERRETVARLWSAVLSAQPSLAPSINPWGYLTFSTPEEKYAFTLVPHKGHVNLQISNGAKFASRLPELEGSGKGIRHIKFPYDRPVDVDLVTKAVRTSLAWRAPA